MSFSWRSWCAALALLLPATALSAAAPERIIAIDVLIEPDAAMLDHAGQMNARLLAHYPAGYALDAAHAPHITLVQSYVRESDLPAIAGAVARVMRDPPPTALRFTATGYVVGASDDAGILMLGVAQTPGVARLHERVVAAVQPFRVAAGDASAFVADATGPITAQTIDWVAHFVPRAAGAAYFPHVTVGVAPRDILQGIAREPFRPFPFGTARVAIYQLGNFGTAQKRLWTAP